MVNMRKRTLKYLTFFLLFIFLTSFVLNYSNTRMPSAWFPKQMVLELSENFRKLIKSQPCTCRNCISQDKVSYWFDQRFNKTMQPLLTAHNALMEEDTYRWWLVSRIGPGSRVGGALGTRQASDSIQCIVPHPTPHTPPLTIPSLSNCLSNVYYVYITEKPCCFSFLWLLSKITVDLVA